MITKKDKLNEEAVLEMNTNMKSLQVMAKSIFNESNKLRSTLLEIAKEKSDSINENESKRNEAKDLDEISRV